MNTLSIPPDQAALITRILHEVFGKTTSYIIGYHCGSATQASALLSCAEASVDRSRFYIVVFTNVSGDGLHEKVSRNVSENSRGTMAVTLLLHKLKSLRAPAADMRWFYERVLHLGYRLETTSEIPYLKNDFASRRDYEAASSYWYKCESVASLYVESAMAGNRLDVELVKLSLLTQAMQYCALGLIRVFMGYTPTNYSLRYLLDLCGHFTTLPSDIFISGNPDSEKQLKIICTPPTMLRHWDRLEMNEYAYASIASCCSTFIQRAGKLALKELEHLKPGQI